MSKFDQNRHSPGQIDGAVWSLAALSTALLLCSVLAAKLVGDMVDSGLTQVSTAISAVSATPKGGGHGIDPLVTGSIPQKGATTARGHGSN